MILLLSFPLIFGSCFRLSDNLLTPRSQNLGEEKTQNQQQKKNPTPKQSKSEESSVTQPWEKEGLPGEGSAAPSAALKLCGQFLRVPGQELWERGKKSRMRIPCQSSLLHFTPLPTSSSRAIPVFTQRAGNCSSDVKAVSQQQLMRAVHHRGFLKSEQGIIHLLSTVSGCNRTAPNRDFC